MLSIDGLRVSVSGRRLFDDFGLTVGNRCVHIAGPNGAGKTSLLKVIAGHTLEHKGQVTYQGAPLLPSTCAMVGHQLGLFPTLTIREMLTFWAKLKGNEELCAAAMTFFELEEHADMRCAALSAGWQKRVALARLMLDPFVPVWLLDEPYVHLDAHAKTLLNGLIAVHCENGGTVLVASHEAVEGALCISLSDWSVSDGPQAPQEGDSSNASEDEVLESSMMRYDETKGGLR